MCLKFSKLLSNWDILPHLAAGEFWCFLAKNPWECPWGLTCFPPSFLFFSPFSSSLIPLSFLHGSSTATAGCHRMCVISLKREMMVLSWLLLLGSTWATFLTNPGVAYDNHLQTRSISIPSSPHPMSIHIITHLHDPLLPSTSSTIGI